MRSFANTTGFSLAGSVPNASPGRLTPVAEAGPNPGQLLAFSHVPDNLLPGAPLVVVLHGCTQDAAGYDRCSGWSDLADEQGFALLFAEQQRANNANLCFNWFRPGDARRDRGEAASIRRMVAAMIDRHRLDPCRIFVTGLSAGGAMAAVMLATYPDVFAGGAVIAGLPFGTANSVPEALDRMRGNGMPAATDLVDLATAASRGDGGPHPSLSVWHGTADATVSSANADALIAQWAGLHGLASSPDRIELVEGQRRSVWHDAGGASVIERFDIAGLGHGTPLKTGGDGALGTAGPHMLEAGINSTRLIAEFWGIARPHRSSAVRPPEANEARLKAAPSALRARPRLRGATSAPAGGVAAVIDRALRTAGLLR